MAEVKIIGNINTTTTISRYKDADKQLLLSKQIFNNFGLVNDYIELHISDIGGNNLLSVDNYKNYKSSPAYALNSDGTLKFIEIDPVENLKSFNYSSGEFVIQYNFFRTRSPKFFIKEISSDRTEIRTTTLGLTNDKIEELALALIKEINDASYYRDYLINFGLNNQVIAVNIALNKNVAGYEILFKLYDPLSDNIDLKHEFTIVDEIIDPYIFQINLDKLISIDALPILRGPNFDIKVDDKNNVQTKYESLDSIISSYQNSSSASYYQVLSFSTSQSIDINVDYTNFENFSKFGSAEKRLANFYNKIVEIESNQTFIKTYTASVATTSSLAREVSVASSSIAQIISNFDGYEYFLYFESSSYTWPKSNSTKPFILANPTSSLALTWITSSLTSAELYDDSNLDNLFHAVPEYVRINEENNPYITFVNMIGHYFDNIWIYLKSITDINKADNGLEEGVSKDLVYYALRDLGIKVYNSKGDIDLTDYIAGNNSGSIDDYVNLSNEFLNNIPKQDLLAETFKRLYHNVSLLFKSKGTRKGLDSINNIFGITGSILNIKEFGGLSKGEYLKGFTTDKVRIINNLPTGSVLSPFISVMEQTTSSFISIDNHKIDISFSPENQIDTKLSASIAVLYPSFDIDDHIGDPRLQYSSSYQNLQYSSSFAYSASFTSSFDYAGFIRLIKFFDNSLFKTLKDFTPARSSTTTGVVIRSPQLERIKLKTLKPDINNEDILDFTYASPTIEEDNDYSLYRGLSGDKKPFYNGQITGSTIDIYGYFLYYNANKWLTFNKIALGLGYHHIVNFNFTFGSASLVEGVNEFNHSVFNVLLNNISGSRLSKTRKILEPAYSGSTLLGYATRSYAELQDSYDNLKTYQLSRYEGVKTTSALYNVYTDGDISYGKTAAIDRNSIKFAWISSVNTYNYNFYDKCNISIKYLVNESGSLTQLTRKNQNLFEVQNIFKAGDQVNISMEDPLNPTNQTSLDGLKLIWKSGFSYSPIIYREINETLYFNFINPSSVITSALGIKGVATALLDWKTIGNADANFLSTPGGPVFFKIDGADQTTETLSYSQVPSTAWTYGSNIPLNDFGPYRSHSGTTFTIGAQVDGNSNYYTIDWFLPINSGSAAGGYATVDFNGSLEIHDTGGEKYVFFTSPRQSIFKVNVNIPMKFTFGSNPDGGPSTFKVVGVLEKKNGSNWDYLTKTTMQAIYIPNAVGGSIGVDEFNSNIFIDDSPADADPYVEFSCILNSYLVTLNQNDQIRLKIYFVEMRNLFIKTNDIDFKVLAGDATQGYFEIIDNVTSLTTPVTTGSIGSTPEFWALDTGSYQAITFNDSASIFYSSSYFIDPTGSISNNISNYYSLVEDPFSFQIGDIIRFGSYFTVNPNYYEISNIIDPVIISIGGFNTIISPLIIGLDRQITAGDFSSQAFAILRKKENETNVMISFQKKDGDTSAGTLIPIDLRNNIRDNVSNIIGPLKIQFLAG